MSQFAPEQTRENSYRHEVRSESKETREVQVDPELQIAASKERADYLVKEVKSNQKQVQNIIMHVVQVRQALKKLRDELQLSAQGDSNSVKQDEARIAILKKQISEYTDELVAMKEDLISFEMESLRDSEPDENARKKLAQKNVENILQELTNI